MLPRCDTFKEIIFTPRLVAFNESFVIAGDKARKSKNTRNTAVIWHEAIRGRSKEDLISTFYAYFSTVRDVEHIILWLDNCSSQNKNWCLYCFFVYLVNSSENDLKMLELKYFEPGHTFMAADSFHHCVEQSLRKKGKIYDYSDYKDAVRKASAQTDVIDMNIGMFYNWKDYTSQYKLKKTVPRPYLHEMVQVNFERGKNTLAYKTDFEGSFISLNFLSAACQKSGKYFNRHDLYESYLHI